MLPWWFMPLIVLFWGSMAVIVVWALAKIARPFVDVLREPPRLTFPRPRIPEARVVERRRW